MKIKVMGAVEAIDQGVGQVIFADARMRRSRVRARAGGEGTVIG